MKTYRQKMQDWVRNKMSNIQDENQISILEEVLLKLKDLESDEKYMVNNIYHEGYIDCERGNTHKTNVYETKFKSHDILRNMIKK